MKDNKTKPTDASVEAYLQAIDDEERRSDCRALVKLMTRLTKKKPKLWGTSIVGFGSYHYRYDSGREGDACVTGFSSRKGAISVYLSASGADQDRLLAKLGPHKMGKACLSLRRLSEIDMKVLEALLEGSIAEVSRRYGTLEANKRARSA